MSGTVKRLRRAARDALAAVGANDLVPTGFGPAGWLDPAIVGEFTKCAAYLGWKLGDLVDFWTPLNEPTVTTTSGRPSSSNI